MQSRENIITPIKDNAGFAFFVESNKEAFLKIVQEINKNLFLDLSKNTICIYGEWAGRGIQKIVAISEIDKSFFIFGIKIATEDEKNYWINCSKFKDVSNRIYNINDFKTYTVTIDFNKPELSQNEILEITNRIEEECPVAKHFGISGIGEGVVWTSDDFLYRFKVKGEKHSKSKVKTLKAVDDLEITKFIELSETLTSSWRLEQGLNEVFNLTNGGILDIKQIGIYLKWIISDILKEEMLVLKENDVEIKSLSKYINDISKKYFLQEYNKV